MKCPHCIVEINPDFTESFLGSRNNLHWSAFTMFCPNKDCAKVIVKLGNAEDMYGNEYDQVHALADPINDFLAYPQTSGRPPAPSEVGDPFSTDYREACLVLPYSQKASAALSRRCLQNILREKAGIKKGSLSDEIQQVIDSGHLPTYIAQSIDAVRNIGNFAAHPMKSKTSGEIADVESGEAEWLLDVLEALFDFYFVQPEVVARKKEALNKKLMDLGKEPMK